MQKVSSYLTIYDIGRRVLGVLGLVFMGQLSVIPVACCLLLCGGSPRHGYLTFNSFSSFSFLVPISFELFSGTNQSF